MTPVPRNVEIPPASQPHVIDPILNWAQSKVSLEPITILQPDELASHLLTTAYNQIVSIKGHFKNVAEVVRTVPADTHIVIMPVTGKAIFHAHGENRLLERGSSIIISGPQELRLTLSSMSFQFLAACLLNSNLTPLSEAELIDLKTGETKFVLNTEVLCTHQRNDLYALYPATGLKNSFLLNLLIASAPRASTEDSFAPKIPATLRPFQGILADIWQNPHLDWHLTEVAQAAHYSQFHFSRLFRSEFQMGFKEYVTECRIRHAANLICNSNLTAQQVMDEVRVGRVSLIRNSLRTALGFSRADLAQRTKRYKENNIT
ncbi:hypothetical protein C0431_15590 [bacterium]|nr:hypothetical protein [bacterium]